VLKKRTTNKKTLRRAKRGALSAKPPGTWPFVRGETGLPPHVLNLAQDGGVKHRSRSLVTDG
jgi:hypothetical protein